MRGGSFISILANQDGEIVDGDRVMQGDILREVAFAIIEERKRIGVIKISAHFIGIGISGQKVAGETLAAQIVEMMKLRRDIIRPIFKRLRAAEIEDAAGDDIIANGKFAVIAIESTM